MPFYCSWAKSSLIRLGGKKSYNGYKAFDFLESGFDYKAFKLAGHPRIEPYVVPLSSNEEERFLDLVEKTILVDLHEHPVLWPEDMRDVPELHRLGRQFTAYEALSKSSLDCVF